MSKPALRKADKAAETAEAIFASARTLEDGQAFYSDIKTRMEKLGHNPDHMKVLPGCLVVVSETVEEAQEKRAVLDSGVHYESAVQAFDCTRHRRIRIRPGRPTAGHPGTNTSQSARSEPSNWRRRRT